MRLFFFAAFFFTLGAGFATYVVPRLQMHEQHVLAGANGDEELSATVTDNIAFMDRYLVELEIDGRRILMVPRYHYVRGQRVEVRLLPYTVFEYGPKGIRVYEEV